MEKSTESKFDLNKNIKLSSKQRKLITGLLAIFLVVTSYACVYRYAHNKGYKAGYKSGEVAGKKASLSSPYDLFNKSLSSPLNIITGKVEKLDGQDLIINTNKGEVKTVKINKDTKITKKTETLKPESLSKGVKVIIYLQSKNSDTNSVASRIVIN